MEAKLQRVLVFLPGSLERPGSRNSVNVEIAKPRFSLFSESDHVDLEDAKSPPPPPTKGPSRPFAGDQGLGFRLYKVFAVCGNRVARVCKKKPF